MTAVWTKVVETEAGSSGFGGDVWKVDTAELADVKNEEDRNLGQALDIVQSSYRMRTEKTPCSQGGKKKQQPHL